MNNIKDENATKASLFVYELLEYGDGCLTTITINPGIFRWYGHCFSPQTISATSPDQFIPIRPRENFLVNNMRY